MINDLNSLQYSNITSPYLNYSSLDIQESEHPLWLKIVFSFFMFPIIFFSISGNFLVIIAIIKCESLHKISNTFLASLAVADCAVGILAMTPYSIQLLSGKWYFKAFLCKLWFSADVLFSTASILHLCCIAIDRFLSVSDKYAYSYNSEEPTALRVKLMIGGSWVISALLSFIPIFTGIFTTKEQLDIIDRLDYSNGHCAFKVNLPYRFISSFISFWIPCIALIIFYSLVIHKAYKIEQRFKKNCGISTKSIKKFSKAEVLKNDTTVESQTNSSTKKKSSQAELIRLPNGLTRNRQSIGNEKGWRSEYRLIRTLGFVIFVFILCWIFFFIRYTFCGTTFNFCPDFIADNLILEDILFWIGYFNSMVNPLLYNYTNQEFRKAFKNLLKLDQRKILCLGGRKKRSPSNVSYVSRRTTFDDTRQYESLILE